MCKHEKILHSEQGYACVLKISHPEENIYGIKIIYDYNFANIYHDVIF